MAGSMRLISRPDTWELRVFIGRDSSSKVKHRYVRFHGTKRQAERELARLVTEQEDKPTAIVETELRWSASTTINDAIEAWSKNGWADLSPATVRRYESLWKVHIQASIGRRRISSLNSYEVEKYLRDLKSQGLAEASVRQTRAVMNRACRLARKWSGAVLPNPVADSEMPSWSIDSRVSVRAPSVDEVQRLLRTAGELDLRFASFLRVIVATGMRRGEACGLRVEDVDLKAGVISIRRSVVAAKGQAAIKSPKTRASIRSVAIDLGTLGTIQSLIESQVALAEHVGESYGLDSYLFSFEPGGKVPPYPDTMTHNFTRARNLAQVPSDIHLHSLRHFQATALDAVISEKQKQSRLGWTNQVMARHYTDRVPEEDRRAAEHVGRLIDEPSYNLQADLMEVSELAAKALEEVGMRASVMCSDKQSVSPPASV